MQIQKEVALKRVLCISTIHNHFISSFLKGVCNIPDVQGPVDKDHTPPSWSYLVIGEEAFHLGQQQLERTEWLGVQRGTGMVRIGRTQNKRERALSYVVVKAGGLHLDFKGQLVTESIDKTVFK